MLNRPLKNDYSHLITVESVYTVQTLSQVWITKNILIRSDGGINDQDRSLLSSSRRSSRRYRGSDGSLARKYPAEWYKTVIMLFYALFCISAMSIVEVIVHDKVPRKFPYFLFE